jgi:hypothetical protein
MATAAVHYLRSNDTTWTPGSLLTLDTETKVIQDDPEVQALRCWHVRAEHRGGDGRGRGEHAQGGGTDAGDLAARVARWSARWPETWLYCHNLNFDLAVTRIPLLLAGDGWEVTDAAVDGGAPWMKLARDGRKLVIADSHAIWPVPLEQLAAAVDIIKPPLPEGDSEALWAARCAADTLILHTALLQLMDWHDVNQLGRWSLTGAATGWNSMRHLMAAKTSKRARTARQNLGLPGVDPAAQPIVIDPDPDGLTFDRMAVYGGRRQTWRHGQLPRGRYSEIDFERAYQTIMAEQALPRRRGRWFDTLDVNDRLIDDPAHQWSIVAECEIETDVPRWPCRIPVGLAAAAVTPDEGVTGMPSRADTRVFYPVGRFRTTLAGPDIAEARRLGCLRAIFRGQVHQLGRALRPWARWSLAAQDDPDTPEVARMALKHQGRAVAGKWAQRTWTRKVIGVSTTWGWSYEDAWVNGAGTRGCIVDIAGTKFLSVPDRDGDNAYPAILAFIEAHVRVAAARVIDGVGADCVVQWDTDGGIVDTARIDNAGPSSKMTRRAAQQAHDDVAAVLELLSHRAAPLHLREKTVYQRIEVIGPQHLTLDGGHRWSGVPGSAEQQADGSWSAWTWPKLAWQMARGDPRGYTRVQQSYRLAGSYAPGWLAADGAVLAVEVVYWPGRGNQLVPWSLTRHALAGARLAPNQPATLAALTRGSDNDGREMDMGRQRTPGGGRRRRDAVHHLVGVQRPLASVRTDRTTAEGVT